jgi:MoxR-like ATPase
MSEKLVVLAGEQKGAELPLSDSPLILGSDTDCGVRLTGGGILGKHAQLQKKRGVWFLEALDVAKPIESDGRLLMEMRLEHGATFQVGAAALRFAAPRATIESASFGGKSFASQEEAVAELGQAKQRILGEVGRVIVGQQAVIMQILVTLFARGHCLIIGVPGLAKTLMIRTLAGALDLDSKRIQFTPDLMPADITGTDILEEDTATGRRRFRFNRGPLFTNLLFADEINRTPPKTQAALLEAMQEQRVTASGLTYDLPRPFMVMATQNPIELEGTYPLPEAQLDRFMFCVHIDYPGPEEEEHIIVETTRDRAWEVDKILNAEAVLWFQHLVRQVPVSPHVAKHASALVRATRPGEESPDFIRQWVRWGAGPRAGQYLLLAAKAHVLLNGRFNVSCEDVRHYARPVLRHRIFRNFAAASEGVTGDDIVARLLDTVKEPDY